MTDTILIIWGLQLGFFSCLFLLAYERGITIGMRAVKGIEPPEIKNPVQVITEAKEAKQQKVVDDLFTQGVNNIFNYDGNPQKEGGR